MRPIGLGYIMPEELKIVYADLRGGKRWKHVPFV